MEDDKKESDGWDGTGAHAGSYPNGLRNPNAPPAKAVRPKRRRAGAQHDNGWPDWKREEKPK